MTPEEAQRNFDFLQASQANSTIRMDRLEANLSRLEENLARLEAKTASHDANLTRLEARSEQASEDMRLLRESVGVQRQTVEIIARLVQDLVKASRNTLERTQQLEARSDSVDEMIRILRELVEGNLRRPDDHAGGPGSPAT